jgi:hypothetical protein
MQAENPKRGARQMANTVAAERAKARLQARMDLAAHRARQAEINAEAEASGAGGVRITDNRTRSRTLVGERKAATGPTENKALSGPAENKGADTLSGVAFASDAAYDAAKSAGLTTDSFKGKRKSGASGFTVADVRKLAEQG